MKKKKNVFLKILKTLYNILDKILITPISKIIYRLNKRLNRNNNFLDNILNKKKSLIVFSLVIAVVIFLFVNGRAVSLVENESEILADQPISVVYNKEKYVVEGVPETADVILMGRQSDLYLAKQLDDHQIVLDLSDYKTGEYNVKLKYNHSVESVKYKIDPSTVKVTISEKISSVKTLTYELMNQDKLDEKLNVSEVELDTNEVYVKGSKNTLDKVATVKALIDVTKLNIDSSGTYKIDESEGNVKADEKAMTLVAYDNDGNIINNVEIVPETVGAVVKVDSYYADVPIVVVPDEDSKMATGYAISSATPSVTTVRVYGNQEAINGIGSIEAVIDVEGLNKDKTFNVNLSKPKGVRYMSETSVSIAVKVAEEATKELTGVSLQHKNLGSDYVANTTNVEDTTVTVILKGASSVIDSITADKVYAYVDLSGLGVGTHDVPITVEGSNTLVSYYAKVQNIQIKISNKN